MVFENFIVNLLLAIESKEEDLKTIQAMVETFNNEIYPNLDKSKLLHLDTMLGIFNLNVESLSNPAYDYILQNMMGFEKADLALFERAKAKLLLHDDDFQKREIDIINFLTNEIEQKSFNIDKNLFIQGLLQLTTQLKNKDIRLNFLNQIKNLIQKEEENI